MFRHRSAILRDATNTENDKSNTPLGVLFAQTLKIKVTLKAINTYIGVLDMSSFVLFVDSLKMALRCRNM
jgi:hypothetical protein